MTNHEHQEKYKHKMMSTHKKYNERERHTQKNTRKNNILYIFMFDTHLMLFGYITRIFVYAIWNMVILLCYSKWHFLYLIHSPSIFMFILNNKIEEKKNIICRTFHLRIHIYIYPPFCTGKKPPPGIRIHLELSCQSDVCQ